MDQQSLRPYARFYKSAAYLDAGRYLRAHLGLEEDFILPLSVSHGVDFGQMFVAMDTYNCEPLHWTSNEDVYHSKKAVKPHVLLPHPYLLVSDRLAPRKGKGKGTLVLGAPPGPEHDEVLLKAISERSEPVTVLVKPKLGFERSLEYWRSKGIEAITLAQYEARNYENMARLFGDFDKVISPNLSSAIFFASAMGKKVELLEDFTLRVWEVHQIKEIFDFDSEFARKVLAPLMDGDQEAMTKVSRSLLGGDIRTSAAEQKEQLFAAIAAIKSPFHVTEKWPKVMHPMLRWASMRAGRVGVLSTGPRDYLRQLRKKRVMLQQLDEIALWRDGPTADNPILQPEPNRPGVTVPGAAVSQYRV